jgi:hypothetical protein
MHRHLFRTEDGIDGSLAIDEAELSVWGMRV